MTTEHTTFDTLQYVTLYESTTQHQTIFYQLPLVDFPCYGVKYLANAEAASVFSAGILQCNDSSVDPSSRNLLTVTGISALLFDAFIF